MFHSELVFPSRNGETLADLEKRVEVTLSTLIRLLEKDEGCTKTILLMTHAAVNILAGRLLTGNSTLEVRTGCCSIGKYTRQSGKEGKSSRWLCELNGEASFLAFGEVNPQPSRQTIN